MKSRFSSQKISQSDLFQSILALPFAIRVLGFIAAITLAISSFFICTTLLDRYLFVSVPKHGGSLSEGVIGRPRLINPVLAKTEADRDLVALIYSGLLRPEGDTLAPDLAENIEVDEEGKVYTVKIRPDAVFHDGTPVTAADVVFTVDRIQNKGLPVKSPLAPNFNGVNVTAADTHTVVFALEKPHATFSDALTFGILPKHIWEPVGTADFDQTNYNLEPIGSGPYKLGSIDQDTKRGLSKEYVLESFDRYVHGEPLIEEMHIFFYGSEEDRAIAYDDGVIDQLAGAQTAFARKAAEEKQPMLSAPMPRIFAVYLNQPKKTLLADDVVRKALDLAMPREQIVTDIFAEYASKEEGPFPGLTTATTTPYDARLLMAQALLEKNGWTRGDNNIYQKVDKKTKQTTQLEFALSLPDIPELTETARIITTAWKTLGINVELKTYDLGTFTADILVSRNFDAALFGQVTGRDPDPYSFWHSSQKTHGSNIAQYGDKKVDARITDLSKTFDADERANILADINQLIMQDRPAIFVYSPKFIYLIGKSVHGVELPLMTTAAERFSGVEKWYVSSERIWKFLAKDRAITEVGSTTTQN